MRAPENPIRKCVCVRVCVSCRTGAVLHKTRHFVPLLLSPGSAALGAHSSFLMVSPCFVLSACACVRTFMWIYDSVDLPCLFLTH